MDEYDSVAAKVAAGFWPCDPRDGFSRVSIADAMAGAFRLHADEKTCRWTPDADGVYQTACGHAFFFDTGTPLENQHHFCGYCGARLIEKRSDE